ncbi:DUF349 domain-containing protein [Modestobacter marinus]|uniref:DUF349 domain-containing protein n=1 Tax=Modestobacter marinus TaxID=477641 RepID=UPI0027DFEA8B|nr:DUF349 domain-containing protein [Modestobacter marinus]
MSSTENTGDRTQQPAAAPDERPDLTVTEVAPVDEGPLSATPDGATGDVPATSDPAPVEMGAEGPAGDEVTAVAPVDEGPLAATPDAAVPQDAPAETPDAPGTPDIIETPDPTATPDTTVAPDGVAPTVETPDAEAPAAETPDAEASTGRHTAEAVTASGGTPAAPTPADAALSDAAHHSHAGGGETPTVIPSVPVSDPTQWGRVDDEGTVYVTTEAGERAVGSWQAGDPAEGLAHYGRRYDDLATEVALLEARLAAHTGNPAEIRTKAEALAETILTASVVGDLDHLAMRARAMVSMADTAVAANRREKAAQRAAQIARKEALAAEAEQIAAESTQWKAAGDRLKAIVEEWKTIKGIDRKTDEALWQRFAAARDAFGRRRGAHFAQLDSQRAEARAAKQELITEAERLSASTDWGPTSAAMRSLMDRWKAVPRTGRDTDDDLWKKFRAAQDVFFAARSAHDQQRSSQEVANQQQKEELLAEAERIDPSKDLRSAQAQLRKIQDRYDAIGHVPRGAMRQLEDRMRAVEQRIRGAVDSVRPRVEPENPLLTSMRQAVAKAEDQLAKAQAAGNARRISEAEANLATRREWLAEAEKSSRR